MDAWHKVSSYGTHVIVVDREDYQTLLSSLSLVIQNLDGAEGYWSVVEQCKRLLSELDN